MADEGIFATTAEVQRKVGANVSATSNAEAFINQYMAEAESYINAITMFNWSDVYSSLNGDTKELLKMAASAYAAKEVINYDTSGMSQREAQTRMSVLFDDFNKAIKLLGDDKVKLFIEGS